MEKKAFKFRMPSSYAILFAIILVVAILTWVVPAGQYQTDDSGNLIPGTYKVIKSHPQGLWDVAKAPIEGMLGNDKTGGAIPVSLFILVIGGFLGIVNKTKALDNGIGSILKKYQGKEKKLIVILMILFSLGGTIYGMAEETLAFYPLLIAIMVSIGLDTIVAVATILIATTVGVLASTVNPFATGVAAQAAGISPGEGLIWRIALYLILVTVAIFYVYRYAAKIEKNPEKSYVYANREADIHKYKLQSVDYKVTKSQKRVLWLFILTFAVMILGLVPWSSINKDWTFFATFTNWFKGIPFLGNFVGQDITPFGDWYFTEITLLFMVMAVIVGLAAGMNESEVVDTFVDGARDMVKIAFIVAIARGIQVVMNDGYMTATLLHFGEENLSNLPPVLFSIITYIFYIPMSLLIYSTSGLASATMGVMSGLGDFVGVPKHIIIMAFQAGNGTVNLFSPTSALVMAVLGMTNIPLGTWFKFISKFLIIVFVIVCAFLALVTFITA
ncbi:YfcC family protein [Bacillus sp. B-jedd]|uniref:YfcC family protein n=1 Tax=Bacillus sp. B-jedd TaxID=1476857 RepID=UPI0005155F66|nr:YfcC family protein [Bacillus sp. B-jedd]CEG28612.1 TRAP transporter, DctM-like membrane protein [Bacillus sp. B-jedd]